MTGSRASDETAAENIARATTANGGLNIKPQSLTDAEDGGTWHHKEGVSTDKQGNLYCEMQLVDKQIHRAIRHDGAYSQYNAIRMKMAYAPDETDDE